jgi:hypothetical protein
LAIKMVRRESDARKLEEALLERSKLVTEVLDIQTSLGDKNRRGPDGKRMEGKVYWDWRGKAMQALAIKQKRIVELKTQIRAHHGATTVEVAGLESTDDESLLKAAYELLRTLHDEEVEFDAKELALIETLRNRFDHGQRH